MVEVDLEMASISVFTWASHINVYVYLQITGSHACDGSFRLSGLLVLVCNALHEWGSI